MADLKISDTKMQETVEMPVKVVVHDYDDLVKRRTEAQEQADMYLSIVKDFDVLLERMNRAGCSATKQEVVDVPVEPIEG